MGLMGEIQDIKSFLQWQYQREIFHYRVLFVLKNGSKMIARKKRFQNNSKEDLYDERNSGHGKYVPMMRILAKPVKRRYQAGFESCRMIDDITSLFWKIMLRYLKPYVLKIYIY